MLEFAPFFARRIGAYVGKLHTIRNEIRTERRIAALPPHIRKDIGWPDRFADGGRGTRRS